MEFSVLRLFLWTENNMFFQCFWGFVGTTKNLAMKKVSKTSCKSASHRLFKDKAKNRVDDLQVMFMDLQFARKESRTIDAAVLEEQVHQMLREWKAELSEPSPASSLQQVSLCSASS